MPRARRTRLARMTAQAGHAESAQASGRAALGAWAAVCTLVREQLAQAGVDPEQVGALRLTPPPNPLPEGQPQEEFVLSDGDGLASVFAGKIGQLAGRYEDGSKPDFANASLAELLAWCISRGD